MRIMALTAVLLLLAGCQESPSKGSEDTPDPSGSPTFDPDTSSPPQDDGTPIPPALVAAMQWTGCEGVYTKFYWPGPTNPSPDFEPWDEREASDLTEIRLLVIDCERFGFGLLERGPVQFVLELTNERQPPPACLALEPVSQPLTMSGAWVSDADVAAALAAEGMPIALGEMVLSVDGSNAHVEWTIDGSTSSLDAYQESASESALLGGTTWRLFWQNALGGVSAVDFGQRVKAPPTPSERPVVGQLAGPMTMAGPYASVGFHFTNSAFGGAITRFGDPSCEQPLQ